MKLGIYYYSTTGNTEEMAKAFAEGAQAAGAEVILSAVGEEDAAELASCDAVALGCPAQGTEEMDDSSFLPFYDEHKEALKDKATFLFGSYGWGGGQYLEDFAQVATGDGLAVKEVYTHLEAPDADTLAELQEKAKAFVG